MKNSHARIVILLTAAVFVLAILRTFPSPPAHRVPDDQFSGFRAHRLLGTLYNGIGPHPAGSPANAILRDRITTALSRLGYTPRVQRAFVCNPWGSCARVENIIAELSGREAGKSVLLVSHYDSVSAGPGAADDGSGVAITLEAARILELGEAPRNSVIFLFTDGEEGGLLGAQAFVAHDPAAKDVGAVVNLEARGTSGSSYMFETNRGNAWVVSLLSRALVRPAASSLFYEIYTRLPNDTDFSVFKRAGMQGANFAFIGDVVRYHTSIDDLRHLSIASLEQQGVNALAMARAFAAADLAGVPSGDATYFDVLQLLVVAWPASWGIGLAIAILLLLGLQLAILSKRGVVRILDALVAAVVSLLATVIAGAFGYGAVLILQASHAFPEPWVARPAAAISCFWAIGLLTACGAALISLRRDRTAAMWAGSGLLFSLLALLLAATLPGTSFLFLVPAASFALTATLWLSDTAGAAVGRWLLPVLAVGVTLLPLAWLLYEGMGLNVMPVVAAFVSLISITFAIPLLAVSPLRGTILFLLGSLVAVLLVIAALLPPWSSEAPRAMNFRYEQQPDGTARWLTSSSYGPLAGPVARSATWSREPVASMSWNPKALSFEAPAPPVALPQLEIDSASHGIGGAKRSARLELRNITPGTRLLIAVHDGGTIESVTVNGVAVPFEAKRPDPEWTTIMLLTAEPEAELNIVTASARPLEAVIQNVISGLPPAGERLLKSRPGDAGPKQNGDVTLVTKRIEL